MERLSDDALRVLPEHVLRPAYDRAEVKTGIVHLGAGPLHRAHQAVYTDDVLRHNPNWGIFAVTLRNSAVAEALQAQNGLYTLLTHDGDIETARVIGSLTGVACLATDRDQVLNALISPDTKVVTLTITQKEYCYNELEQCLDLTAPDVRSDIAAPQHANSAAGVLTWAIHQRKQRGADPFTLLSCDPIPANGKVLQRVLAQYIEQVQDDLGDPQLLQYFLDRHACPCSLVDRYTPSVLSSDLAHAQQLLGVHDAVPVITEPFSQWVIQDWFSAERPPWEAAGAIFATHVAPYEKMVERLRDASYLAVATLGEVAGFPTAAAAMQDRDFSHFVHELLDDASATLPRQAEVNVSEYKIGMVDRLRNTGFDITTAQLAIDCSPLLGPALLAPMQERLHQGLPIDHHAMVVAGWIRRCLGTNERQEELLVSDPLLNDIRAAIAKAGGPYANAYDLTDAMLGIESIFGTELREDLEFHRCVTACLQALQTYRVLPSLAQLRTPDAVL